MSVVSGTWLFVKQSRTANLIERIGNFISEHFGVKSESLENLSLVESYNVNSYEIENVESFYKIISKVSAIPKAIQETALAITSREWKIYNKRTDEEIENVPEKILMLIKNPWVFYSLDELVGLFVLDILVSGNIFAYLVSDKGRGLSLRRLDPQFVQWDETDGWIENHPNGVNKINEKFLIHVKFQVDPFNPRWGKGIIANNVTTFVNIISMLVFRQNFYKKGCFPSGVFGIENAGAINETQARAKLEERNQGAKNAGTPIVLSGKVTYNQIQMDPTALKISQELMLLTKEALDAFGIPRYMHPSILDGGQKYNNHSLQDEHWIKSSVIPIAKKIALIFTNVLQRFNPDWEFRFDISGDVYDDATLQAMADAGELTPNEHRELLGIPESEDDGMDSHWIPSGKQPMDIALDPPEPPAPPALPPAQPSNPPANPNEQQPAKDEIANGRMREKSWRDDDYVSSPESGIWTKDELTKAVNKNRIRRDFVTINSKTRTKKSRESLKGLRGYLVDTYSNVIASVARHAQALDRLSQTKPKSDSETLQTKDAAGRIINEIYNESENLAKLEVITLPLHKGVGEATFANTANILTVATPFSTADPGVAAKLDILRKNGPLVTNVTKGKISETIHDGIAAGKTHTEIAKDLWTRFVDDNDEFTEEFSRIYRPGCKPKDFDAVMTKGGKLQNRAVLIARTEVAYANKIFSTESMQRSGVVKSVTIIDCDPCPVCAPHQNVPVSFENAETIQNIHPNCTGTVVPSEIGVGE